MYLCVSFDRQIVGSLQAQVQTTNFWSTYCLERSRQSLWLRFLSHLPWGWMDHSKDVGIRRNLAWKPCCLIQLNLWLKKKFLDIHQTKHVIFPCYLILNLPIYSLHLQEGECCSSQGVVPSCQWFSSCMRSKGANPCENKWIWNSLAFSLCPC